MPNHIISQITSGLGEVSGTRQRQLSLQKLDYQPEKGEVKQKNTLKVSHNQALKVGQFSMQIWSEHLELDHYQPEI